MRLNPRRAPILNTARVLFLANQDFALAGVIGLADDAFLLHPLHDRGGAVVADLQPALDVAGRGLLVAGDDLHRLLVEVGGVAGRAHAGGVEHRIAVLVDLSSSAAVTASRYCGWPCDLRWRTTFSTSSSDTNGPWTRLMRPPPAM